MKLPLENKHVERVLSLIVIFYGLWLIVQNTTHFIVFMQRGIDFMQITLTFVLPNMIVGCLLMIFFARVVQWVGYFATGGAKRPNRHWHVSEIVAIPLIFYIFTIFVSLFKAVVVVIFFCFYDFSGIQGNFDGNFFIGLSVLLFCLFVLTVILFRTRRLAAWFLRLADRCSGVQ